MKKLIQLGLLLLLVSCNLVAENKVTNDFFGITSVPQAVLELTPNSISGMDLAGGVSPGTIHTLTLTNTGKVSSELISSPIIGGESAFIEVVTDNCFNQALTPSMSCTIDIRAIATNNRSFNATIESTTGLVASNVVALSGTTSGFPTTPFLILSPTNLTSLNIAGVSPGTIQTITLTNDGDGTSANLLAPSITGDTVNLEVVTDNCVGTTLAPAANCTIDVRPTSFLNRSYSGDITLNDGSAFSNTTSWSGVSSGFTPFISVWNTSGAAENITLPLRTGFNYDFHVDWGDGTPIQHITVWDEANTTHNYATASNHTIKIGGLAEALYINSSADKDKILSVPDLGDVGWIDLSYAFTGATNLATLAGGNTSGVTNMEGMFQGASGLTSLNLSSFNTSSVTGMAYMFMGAGSLTNLNLSSFNTSSVTDMTGMFENVSGLSSLDLSMFVTTSVIDMKFMFSGASGISTLNLSSFNTSIVTNMSLMFKGTSALTTLDLSSFNTSNVTTMGSMFFGASALTTLNISSFNTALNTNMDYMFDSVASLVSLDLSHFDTTNVTSMISTFKGMSLLSNLNLSGFNTSNVTLMSLLFAQASSLQNLDLSSFNTSNVINMSYMFMGMTALTSLDLSHFNTSLVNDMDFAFMNSSALSSLNLNNWDITTSTPTSSNTFTGMTANIYCDQGGPPGTGTIFGSTCEAMAPFVSQWSTSAPNETVTLPLPAGNLYNFSVDWGDASPITRVMSDTDLNKTHTYVASGAYTVTINGLVEGWNFNNAGSKDNITAVTDFGATGWKNLYAAFAGTSNLTSFAGGITPFATDMSGMFVMTPALATIDLSTFDTTNVTNMNSMFYRATAVGTLNLTNFITTNVTDMASMFDETTALTSVDVTSFNTANVTDMNSMFYLATALGSVDLSSFTTANVTDMSSMFEIAASLTTLDLSHFNTAAVTNMSSMFEAMPSMTSLTLNTWDISNALASTYVFDSMAGVLYCDQGTMFGVPCT